MKLKYRFFLIFSALAVVPLFLFSYIAYNHYINLSNSQITETSSKIMEQAVQETDSVFGSMQHILELVQYTSPNEETILQELGKFADPNSEQKNEVHFSEFCFFYRKYQWNLYLYAIEGSVGTRLWKWCGCKE